jgi:hypothetical protein
MVEQEPDAEYYDFGADMRRRRRLLAMATVTALYLLMRHPVEPTLMVSHISLKQTKRSSDVYLL